MEDLKICTKCFLKSSKEEKVCPFCQNPFPVEPDVPATPQAMGYSSSEVNQARRLYNQHKKGRPKGYRIWLLGALLWGAFGIYGYNNGMITSTGNVLVQTILVFGVSSAIMLLLFFVGKTRSKKTYAKREAMFKSIDPRLTAFFAWQDNRNASMDDEYIPDEQAIREAEKEKREDEKFKKKMEDIWIYD